MKSFASLFKALADESRLRIINLLYHSGELCVCDIQDVMGFTQTKVSRHLAYLRRAGLVDDRKQGLWMFYSIARPGNDKQRRMLEFLAGLLKSDDAARNDALRLAANIKKGCCATCRIQTSNRPSKTSTARSRENRVPAAVPGAAAGATRRLPAQSR